MLNKDDLLRRQKRHWSFQPIVPPAVPTVKNRAWVRNAVDSFVLAAKLEANDLPPAAQADRAAFYRRMHFDLVGLPPTPEQIETDLALPEVNVHNPRFEVDKLLESPHYGERWARLA